MSFIIREISEWKGSKVNLRYSTSGPPIFPPIEALKVYFKEDNDFISLDLANRHSDTLRIQFYDWVSTV